MLDPDLRANLSGTSSLQPKLPSKAELQYRVREFKKSLDLPPEKTREIEQNTRDQHNSPLWFSVRRYRLTASYFGAIYCRRSDTPPQALVLQILGTKQVTAPALEWHMKKLHCSSMSIINIQLVILVFFAVTQDS